MFVLIYFLIMKTKFSTKNISHQLLKIFLVRDLKIKKVEIIKFFFFCKLMKLNLCKNQQISHFPVREKFNEDPLKNIQKGFHWFNLGIVFLSQILDFKKAQDLSGSFCGKIFVEIQ